VFRFDSLSDIGSFEVATDRAMGGTTVCSFGVKTTRDGVVGVFEGVMRNDDPLFRSDDGRSAVYASFRTKVQCPMPDLSPFSALQLTVKTDGRPYLVVLSSKNESYETALDEAQALNSSETWQCELAVPGGRWVTVTAPFDSFVRVDRGHVTVQQRPDATDGEAGVFHGPNPGALQSVSHRRRGAPRAGEGLLAPGLLPLPSDIGSLPPPLPAQCHQRHRPVCACRPCPRSQLAVVLADGLPGEFRMCLAEVRAVRHYVKERHTLALPAGTARLQRRSRRLSGNAQPGAAAGRIEGPARRLPDTGGGGFGGEGRGRA